MKWVIGQVQSMKMLIGCLLIIVAKLDFYFNESATEAGVNNFIIWVLGFMFAARVADKVVSIKSKGSVT